MRSLINEIVLTVTELRFFNNKFQERKILVPLSISCFVVILIFVSYLLWKDSKAMDHSITLE